MALPAPIQISEGFLQKRHGTSLGKPLDRLLICCVNGNIYINIYKYRYTQKRPAKHGFSRRVRGRNKTHDFWSPDVTPIPTANRHGGAVGGVCGRGVETPREVRSTAGPGAAQGPGPWLHGLVSGAADLARRGRTCEVSGGSVMIW